MARRITGVVVAVTLGCILVLLALALPARASEPNPYHYWSSERLNSEGRWSHVCDVRGDDLLWSEPSPGFEGASGVADDPRLLDMASGARSLPAAGLMLASPAPAPVRGGGLAPTPRSVLMPIGPYYAAKELFRFGIQAAGGRREGPAFAAR